MFLKKLLLFIVAVFFAQLFALEKPCLNKIIFCEENDGFGSHGLLQPVSDNYYTQGAKLISFFDVGEAAQLRFGISHLVYSPDNITTSDLKILRGDQPYAGWLFLDIGYLWRSPIFAMEAVLKLGVVGPAAQAGNLQKAWHRFVRYANGRESPPPPGGLGVYEIADAPAVDFVYSGEVHPVQITIRNHCGSQGTFLGGKPATLRPFASFSAEAGTVLGSASIGSGVRIGFFESQSEIDSMNGFSLNFSAEGRLSVVTAWNELVEGKLVNGIKNESRFRPFGQSVRMGTNFGYHRLAFSFEQIIEKQSVNTLPTGVPLWHHYGSLGMAVRF